MWGRVALASARVAYQRYLAKFAGPEWEQLLALGPGRNGRCGPALELRTPTYSDMLYVAEPIGPEVINTVPEQTPHAFADHGEVARTVDADPAGPAQVLADAASTGIDLAGITAELEREGVQSLRLLPPAARRRGCGSGSDHR